MAKIIITAVKLIFAVLIFPIVIASTLSFVDHSTDFPPEFQDFFLWGILTFLLIFLFFYQFWGVYEFGQKITSSVFKFIAPFDHYAVQIIPFYFILVMLLFYVETALFKTHNYDHYFLFFAGFTITMHILLAAQDLQEQEKTTIKPTYLFWMGVIYTVNISLVVLFLDLNAGDFTFPKYFQSIADQSWAIYSSCWEMVSAFLLKMWK